MSLFTDLTTSARALEAQRMGLEVTGQNIANVNTPGYSRRLVEFASVPPEAGGGVDVMGVRASRDRLLESRLLRELPAAHREAAMADGLSVVETALGDGGQSIDAALTEFFDAFSRLAERPTATVARQEVILQGQAIATSFQDMAQRLESAQVDTDRRIRSTVDEVNALAEQIAVLNKSLGGPQDASQTHLQDEQAGLVRKLSELVDISAIEREGGGMDVTFANGRSLVIGDRAQTLVATPTGLSGLSTLSVAGFPITSEITGGSLGGLLNVRDVNIPDYMNRLDTLAFNFADQVNTAHQGGFTLTGATGQDFFVQPGAVAGAARTMSVEAAVVADDRLIAASGTAGNEGDNSVATTIARLRDARVLNGNTTTFSDSWGQLVYRVGRDTQTAKAEQISRDEIVRQVETLRDEVSGISLDEETMHLLKYQRAYEANARFFSVINSAIDTLIQTMGR